VLSLLHALNYVADNKIWSLWLSGLFLGVALGARPTMAYAAVGIGLALFAALLVHGRGLSVSLTRPALWGALAVFTTVGWLGWNGTTSVRRSTRCSRTSSLPKPRSRSPTPSFPRSLARLLAHARGLGETLLLPFTLILSHDPPNGVWGSVPFPAFLGFLPLVLLAFRSQWQAWDGSSHRELNDSEASADWEAHKFRELLVARGITHVVFNPALYMNLFQVPGAVYGRVPEVREKAARSVQFFQHFAAEQMKLLHRDGPMLLYTWKERAQPAPLAGPYTRQQ
jgi:hypothetical protein